MLRAHQSGQYQVNDIAASFQQAVVDCLIDRTARAIDAAEGATALVVAGGVAANLAIRTALEEARRKAWPAFYCATFGSAQTMRR